MTKKNVIYIYFLRKYIDMVGYVENICQENVMENKTRLADSNDGGFLKKESLLTIIN